VHRVNDDWLAPCPFAIDRRPSPAPVIAARHPRPIAPRSAWSSLRIATAVGVILIAACRGSDAPAATAGAQAASPATASDAGEVVITQPSGRYVPDSATTGGSITGTITTSSPLSVGAPVNAGRDAPVCGPSIPDESVIQQGNGLGGAVVWLEDIRRGKPIPLERRLELESDHCRLVPRVQGAVVGSAVNVLGHDNFRQHLRFVAGGEPEPRASVLLDAEEQVIPTERPFLTPGLVMVRDADHPWPTAYIAVFDHPYFAVTAPNGTFTIDRVPPGRYRMKVWHERTKVAEQTVEVGPGTASVNVRLEAK
jgi:hypothetical protein